MNVEQYLRKSFPVDAVRVTADNMEEVARWCDGSIHEDHTDENPSANPHYIKVRVQNPLTERQTRAYDGDWVLYAGKGYKVYTDRAFRKSFDEKPQNVFEAGVSGGGGFTHARSGGGGAGNPGGTRAVG